MSAGLRCVTGCDSMKKVLTTGMSAEYVADGFGVGTDTIDSRDKITAVALEEDTVFSPVVIFVVFFPCALEEGIVFCFGVEHKSAFRVSKCLSAVARIDAHPPPITLLSPLNTLVRLLTTTSAYCRTLTLMKLPIVSSTTTQKSYWSASLRMRSRSGDLSNGFPGNSVKRATNLSPPSNRCSRSSRSSDEPKP